MAAIDFIKVEGDRLCCAVAFSGLRVYSSFSLVELHQRVAVFARGEQRQEADYDEQTNNQKQNSSYVWGHGNLLSRLRIWYSYNALSSVLVPSFYYIEHYLGRIVPYRGLTRSLQSHNKQGGTGAYINQYRNFTRNMHSPTSLIGTKTEIIGVTISVKSQALSPVWLLLAH